MIPLRIRNNYFDDTKYHRTCVRPWAIATVSDKNSWDTLTKRCFFPSRAHLVPLKVVYRGSVTKSRTPTLRGQGDPKVPQPF